MRTVRKGWLCGDGLKPRRVLQETSCGYIFRPGEGGWRRIGKHERVVLLPRRIIRSDWPPVVAHALAIARMGVDLRVLTQLPTRRADNLHVPWRITWNASAEPLATPRASVPPKWNWKARQMPGTLTTVSFAHRAISVISTPTLRTTACPRGPSGTRSNA